jgi:uncharacterized protein YcaQ
MLQALWLEGKIVVAGRERGQKLWDLSDRWLPDWTPKERLSPHEVVRRAAIRSLRALGVATPTHIERHFTVGFYPGLPRVLTELEAEGAIVPVQVGSPTAPWPGRWFVHAEDLPLLSRLETGEWEPRTTLLSPFDNLIVDRTRTEELFGFRYRMEIYVPAPRRKYGYYVLPILHGDRFVGRIDPAMDRGRGVLTVKAVHAEPDAQSGAGPAVRRAIKELATFLGARHIVYTGTVPDVWKRSLR